VVVLVAALGAAFILIELRLVQLQVLQSARLRRAARSQQERVIKLDPKRGAIYDRNGKELALSVDVDSVVADPARVPNASAAARKLAGALGVRFEEVRAKLRGGRRFAWIERKIRPAERAAVERLGLEGIDFVAESKRFYPKKTLAAHVLGYAGMDNQGLEGIEYALDADVQGEPGYLLALRDGHGDHALRTRERPPTAGRAVYLTIDEVIQHLAERELESAVRGHDAKGGSVIVMRPDTGEILALANRPTFDPNDYRASSDDARRNRAIGSLYEPGSTFKVVTAGAALEEKKVTPNTLVYCEHGSITVARHRIQEDRIPFDYLTVEGIVEKSSNVGAVKLGLMLSPAVFHRHLTDFGFGQTTGIDLPGESKGILRPPSAWSGLSQASLSIGQEVGVTALQTVTAMAAIANGGVLRRPYVVGGLAGEDGTIARPARSADPGRRIVSEETARALTRMLEKVVTDGTGTSASIPGHRVAGKTGTAQKIDESGRYAPGKYVASFAGFVPAREPALAIVVVVDEPRGKSFHGGQAAAPAFARIALPALQYLGVMPGDGGVILDRGAEVRASLERLGSAPSTLPLLAARLPRAAEQPARFVPLRRTATSRGETGRRESAEMPDLSGRSLREAAVVLAQMGLVARFSGKGPVVGDQTPGPGAEVAAGTPVHVTMTGDAR
jgi:cell division protein FtsI (penicillin-binding protein 3)